MAFRALSSLLAVAALAVLAGLGIAGDSRAETRPAFVAQACPEALNDTGRTVACGYVMVPQDRGAPAGLWVKLPVVVVKAATPVKGAVPVVYLHGGPGGGVVSGVAETLTAEVGLELVGRDQDWVFFDQRGAESARPTLDCGDLALNDAGPSGPAVVQALAACARRLEREGVDFRRYTSKDIVADLRDIRTALGLGEVKLYGLSYGTRVAMSALVHDPVGIRAVILDSPWPPEARWTDTAPVWVSREVRRVLARCAADADCSARRPDGAAKLERFASRLAAGPLIEGGRAYRAEMLALFLMDALYDPDGVRSLPASIDRFASNDLSELDRYAEGSDAGYAEAMHMAVLCNEEFVFESRQAVVDAARGDPIAEAVASTVVNYFDACGAFGPGAPDPVEQQPVRSGVPTLFLAAGIDAGCPAELSEQAVKGFANGKLVVVANATHGVSAHSPCGRRVARAFLLAPGAPLIGDCVEEGALGIEFK